MDVIVVLPWAPVTAMPRPLLSSSASTSAVQDLDASLARGNYFRILTRNGTGIDHMSRAVDIFRRVAKENLRAKVL